MFTKTVTFDLVIGFQWTFFYFVVLKIFFKIKKSLLELDIKCAGNRKKTTFSEHGWIWHINFSKTLTFDLVIGFQWTFFYFVALKIIFKIKKCLLELDIKCAGNRKKTTFSGTWIDLRFYSNSIVTQCQSLTDHVLKEFILKKSLLI